MSAPLNHEPLNHDWKIIAAAEGGEVLACLDDSRDGYVKGIQPFYQSGESPGEAVALFKIA
jgi:hypothetical protein